MKSFFKYLLASILGVIIASLIIFFAFIIFLSAVITIQDKPVDIKSNTILLLKLDQPINDRKSNFPMFAYNFSNFGAESQLGLNDILDNIEKAAKDEKIKGIYLQLSGLQTGIATVEEIRNALIKFKNAGKFIIAFSDTYTQGSFYLASVADKIYLNPGGSVNLIGLSADLVFFKKTLEKLDIEPEIVRHGKFKSAVEPFMYDKMSAENREQIRTYVGSIWEHMVRKISESRNITPEQINQFADSLLMWDVKSALRYGVIDAALYKDQVLDSLAKLTDRDKSSDLEFITHSKYLRVDGSGSNKGYSRNKIAVIYAEGDIVPGEMGEGFIGSEVVSRTIREARQDSAVKAIVFRVNSGGGSALASEVIWRELDLARQVKPVIASLGDVAASGGYYIVAPADTIVAGPTTITGSIGVFGLLVNAQGFFNNKLGITFDVEKTNDWSDFASIIRPLSDAERIVLQKMVDDTYNTFVSRVSDGRTMAYSEVDKIGEGRVWSGKNALDIGLVDVIGGLSDAINLAAEKAGLKDDYRLVNLPRLEDPFTQVMKELTGDVRDRIIKREFSEQYKYYSFVKNLFNNDRIQARMPFEMTVH
ncbi:MAG TPA: signal peptide peptidase SppA [Bacteroidales bacterium]|jgi:protease-4|nr:signal peptide peptidase SppA [Bacteroidales bacterium]